MKPFTTNSCEKLKAKVETLTVGPSDELSNYMGPVISLRAKESILKYIETGKKEGRLITGGEPAEGDGYFIKPTVIADVDSKARIFQEEIFGPVLAVTKARDFDHALAARQRFRIRPDGRCLHKQSGKGGEGQAPVLRRQSVHQSQVHRRHGRRTSIRRLQYVRNRFKGRRPRLPAAVRAGQINCRKSELTQQRYTR